MSNIRIALDAGHGLPGSGANGKIDEAAQAWKLACFVGIELSLLGIDSMLSRTQNEKPELDERARRAKAGGCGAYISIHFNAGGGDGVEVYPQFYGDKGICAASDKLASSVLNAVVAAGQQSRGIKRLKNSDNTREYYGMLYYPRLQSIPAILLELAFVDTKDALDFDTDAELKKWAAIIAKAIATVYPPAVKKAYTVTISGTGTQAEAAGLLNKVKSAGFPATLQY